jgi:hypothetical protein
MPKGGYLPSETSKPRGMKVGTDEYYQWAYGKRGKDVIDLAPKAKSPSAKKKTMKLKDMGKKGR